VCVCVCGVCVCVCVCVCAVRALPWWLRQDLLKCWQSSAVQQAVGSHKTASYMHSHCRGNLQSKCLHRYLYIAVTSHRTLLLPVTVHCCYQSPQHSTLLLPVNVHCCYQSPYMAVTSHRNPVHYCYPSPYTAVTSHRNTRHATRTPCFTMFMFIYYLFILLTPTINGETKHLLIKLPIQRFSYKLTMRRARVRFIPLRLS
jgi:hypothetical protein